MVLESTMFCVDNSDYANNGDFLPTRLMAQNEAVNAMCRSKSRANPENDFGLITLSKSTDILANLTADQNKLLTKLADVKASGSLNFIIGIRRAHMVLKHRQGKHHRMSIVSFVGSPLEDSEEDLIRLGKTLRKEKVGVVVISFGETEANTGKLTSFVNTVNGADSTPSSYLLTITTGSSIMNALRSSPIMGGGEMVSQIDADFDDEDDPELAMALRISMEQELGQRTAAAVQASNNEITPMPEETEDEVRLRHALAMSEQYSEVVGSPSASNMEWNTESMTEEEQIAFAIQMSLGMETTMEDSKGNVEKKEDDKMDEN